MTSDTFRFASPQAFFPVAGKLIPWFSSLAALLALAGLYVAFFVAPTDATQGESYRIIFIHVPAAWMSMFIYVVMAGWAGFGLAMNTRLSGMMASALAPTGAMFTFLALVGVVNIPIIYFSVQWWNTLHQGASVSLTRAPSMAATMLLGMLLMTLAAWMYSIATTLARLRNIILERERDAEWVRMQRTAA